MPSIAEADNRVRKEIESRVCPECSAYLQPRPHQDPKKLFVCTQIRYQAWCPLCRKLIEE